MFMVLAKLIGKRKLIYRIFSVNESLFFYIYNGTSYDERSPEDSLKFYQNKYIN